MLIAAKIAGLLLTPPGLILLLAAAGLLLQIRWPSIGTGIIAAAFLTLLVLSLPITGHQLTAALEADIRPLPGLTPETARRQAQAIVVLGGGRAAAAAEYGGDTVNSLTLERLRYAVRLHRATKLPILVSGGAPFGEKITEAELMRQTLEQDFQVRAKWVEDHSRTTFENAAYTKAMLAGAGIQRVFVVTHSWHAPRARWAFQHVGLDATIAPTLLTQWTADGVLDYVPSARGLSLTSRAMSEWLGLRWYQYRHSLVREPVSPKQAPDGVS